MKVVNLRHVAKKDLLFVLQRSGDEVRHGWIIHLRGVTLKDTKPNVMSDGKDEDTLVSSRED